MESFKALHFESKHQTHILPWNMTDIPKIYKQKIKKKRMLMLILT